MTEAVGSLRFLVSHSVTYLFRQMYLNNFWLASNVAYSPLQLSHTTRHRFIPLRHVIKSPSRLFADEWIAMSIIWFALRRLIWRFYEIERFFIIDDLFFVKIWTLHYFICSVCSVV